MKDGELFIVSIDNQYKVINEKEETIIDLGCLHDLPIHFENTLLLKNCVEKNGILSLNNKPMQVKFEYGEIFPYMKNNIAFAKKHSTYKLISHDNTVLNDMEIDKIEYLLIEDLLLIQVGKDFYIFNTREKAFIPLKTKSNSSNILADVLKIFLKNKTNDVLDLKSNLKKLDTYHFINKLPYHSSEYQYFKAITNNKYVLLKVGENFHIEEVVQFENELCDYNDKLRGFVFMENGKFGFNRIDGTIKLDPIFDQIYSTKYYGSNILCAVDNDLYFISSNSNDTSNFKVKDYKIIYEHSFKEPFYHNKGQIYVIKGVDKDNKIMLYDTYGKPMLDTTYDEITHLGDSYFVIKDKENVGLLNTKNKPKVEMEVKFKNIFYTNGEFYGVDENKILGSFKPYHF
ncbi:MAG: hypothetical protein IPN97_11115 [Saprospiraceae bacterium]|nr:hypothetical protein [Saprospiraceae bacterium]MBK9043721.1 hypothetical protein [Saprospiraceae bacterium]